MRNALAYARGAMTVALHRPAHPCTALGLSLLVAMAAPVRGASSVPLAIEAKISLGEVRGRIDHLGVDLRHHRLYVAELGNDSVGVVDLQTGKTVQTLRGLKEPQGIGYDSDTDALYVANGRDGSVDVFGGSDLMPLATIELGDDADNIRIEEGEHRLWVGYGSGALAAINTRTRRKIGEIPLGGHPESFRLAPAGSAIYVNVPDAGEIAVVDRATRKRIATWRTGDLRYNYPLALNESGEEVLAVFRRPARLAVFRAQDGKRLQVLETCADADDEFIDAKRQRVYVICGAGSIDVFSRDNGGYRHTARLATFVGARTSLFVPELDRLYLAVPEDLSTPASIWVIRPEGPSQVTAAGLPLHLAGFTMGRWSIPPIAVNVALSQGVMRTVCLIRSVTSDSACGFRAAHHSSIRSIRTSSGQLTAMDTVRVRILREHPQVRSLLRSLLAATRSIPPDSEAVSLAGELPAELAFVLERAQSEGRAWQAWRRKQDVGAVSAELDETASRIQGLPVLTLFEHDAKGLVTRSSSWMERESGEWVMRSTGRRRHTF